MTTFVSPVRSIVAPTGETWSLLGTATDLKHDDDGPMYLSTVGTAGNGATTPDTGQIPLTGDFELEFDLALVDYSPAAQSRVVGQFGTAGNHSWVFYFNGANGAPVLWTSTDGTTLVRVFTVSNPGWVDGTRYKFLVKYRYNDGGVSTVEFFYQAIGASAWTQIGAKQSHTGLIPLFNSTHPVGVGGDSNGNSGITGSLYEVIIRNGIGGAVVNRFNPSINGLGAVGVRGLLRGPSTPGVPGVQTFVAPQLLNLMMGQLYYSAVAQPDLTGFIWPAQSASKRKRPRVLRATFGDGYEQRAADGINFNPREWQLTWVGTPSVIDAIEAFLEDAGGVDAFDWQDPEGYSAKWTCEEWSRGPVDQTMNAYTFSAVFKQAYGY